MRGIGRGMEYICIVDALGRKVTGKRTVHSCKDPSDLVVVNLVLLYGGVP